jgi:hypothetical protein
MGYKIIKNMVGTLSLLLNLELLIRDLRKVVYFQDSHLILVVIELMLQLLAYWS